MCDRRAKAKDGLVSGLSRLSSLLPLGVLTGNATLFIVRLLDQVLFYAYSFLFKVNIHSHFFLLPMCIKCITFIAQVR